MMIKDNRIAEKIENELLPGQPGRFQKQIDFILEADKLKNTFRQTFLMDRSRRENSAEQSWQEHDVKSSQVISRMQPVEDGSSFLWNYVSALLDDAVSKGYLAK